MYSDTECSRRTGSVRSSHSSNRYVRGFGSNQDLSKRSPTMPPPSITDIIYNNEIFPLFAEFLQTHGRESLSGFCAIVIGMATLASDKRQAMCAARAAFSTYINNELMSNGWLQPVTRELIRKQVFERKFDPYRLFEPAMRDMLQYLKQNFYANFLSSQLWKDFLMRKQHEEAIIAKRNKLMTSSSTPKKINLSMTTSTIKSSKQHQIKREILSNYNGNRTVGSTISVKTPLACFIQNNDVPYVIHLNIPVERVTLNDIKPRIHHLAGKKFNSHQANIQCHYYFKRRIDPSEMCLMNDSTTSMPPYVYEEIDSDDISASVPHLDGTIVCKFDFGSS